MSTRRSFLTTLSTLLSPLAFWRPKAQASMEMPPILTYQPATANRFPEGWVAWCPEDWIAWRKDGQIVGYLRWDEYERLAQNEATDRWIPVTERLPDLKHSRRVRFAFDASGKIAISPSEAKSYGFIEVQESEKVLVCHQGHPHAYESRRFYSDEQSLDIFQWGESVTHWRPLPAPPKEIA
jgi:hypothetical protein